MAITWRKSRRTSSEQGASPRRGRRSRIIKGFFRPASPTSSSSPSSSPSPPRRRNALSKIVYKVVHPRRSSIVPDVDAKQHSVQQDPGATSFRGVRYRVELNKYVTEIRPTRSTKKIWLGTYDTAEEAARAFDIGNLCCKKNLPLNFPDSPRMLRKISSKLSPEEARSAIANLAKEVARVVNINSTSDDEEVDRAAAKKPHDQVEYEKPEAEELLPVRTDSDPRTQLLEASGMGSSVTYTEKLRENVVAVIEEDLVATPMPFEAGGEGGSSGHSSSFDLCAQMFLLDDQYANIPLDKLINFVSDQPKYGDVPFPCYKL